MQLPPNYGVKYVNEFRAAFGNVARDERVAFVPFLSKVSTSASNSRPMPCTPPPGAAVLLENVWRKLGGMVVLPPK